MIEIKFKLSAQIGDIVVEETTIVGEEDFNRAISMFIDRIKSVFTGRLIDILRNSTAPEQLKLPF